jgi:hypothetical protein
MAERASRVNERGLLRLEILHEFEAGLHLGEIVFPVVFILGMKGSWKTDLGIGA